MLYARIIMAYRRCKAWRACMVGNGEVLPQERDVKKLVIEYRIDPLVGENEKLERL
jgi:hypothetical protein